MNEPAPDSYSWRCRLRRLLAEPVRDYVAAVDAMRERGAAGLIIAGLALVLSWFVYVPIHELLHAWGCMLAGGSVTRLEIAPEYGGALLANVFPFVVSGSNYAGQLTGFDTRGNDAIYLATVLAPFLLTIFAGVPLLKALGQPTASAALRPWLLGGAAVLAYAPVVSLIGDYYEAGSIIVSRVAHAVDPAIPLERWRSDDLPKLVGQLHERGAGAVDWIGVASGAALAIVLALLTYRAGTFVARMIASRGRR